jgi:group I intron endonuclease
MNSGIYQIKNLSTGMSYIGRTIDWSARKRRHLSDLRAGRHKNPRLQHSWSSRSEQEFEFKLVWPEVVEQLEELESFVLEECFDTGRLYNAHKNSVGGFLGQKHSEETKRKWADARRGKKASPQARARIKESLSKSERAKKHREWMQSPEAIADRCTKAAKPEVRAKAVATRVANGFDIVPKSWEEARQKQIELAKQNLFKALDWAVKNKATRDQAIVKFGSSWGSLKKFQPEWEAKNGPLNLPKRASGKRVKENNHAN